MDFFEQASDFISSEYFRWIVYGVIVYLGILWLALVAWVARDVVQRSRSLFFQTLMILLNMILPVFALFVYLLLRPPKTLMERYYDEVELRLLQEASHEHAGTEREKVSKHPKAKTKKD